MKKIILVSILTLSMITSMTGCTTFEKSSDSSQDTPPLVESPESPKEEAPKEEAPKEEAPSGTTEPAVLVQEKQGVGEDYEIHTLAFLEDDLQTALGYVQQHHGFGIIKEEQDGLFVYIGLGEKPTAGYSVEIENVVKKDDKIKIIVKEVQPGKDAIVTQAITYPTKVVKIKDSVKNIEVVDLEGNLLQDINAGD